MKSREINKLGKMRQQIIDHRGSCKLEYPSSKEASRMYSKDFSRLVNIDNRLRELQGKLSGSRPGGFK